MEACVREAVMSKRETVSVEAHLLEMLQHSLDRVECKAVWKRQFDVVQYLGLLLLRPSGLLRLLVPVVTTIRPMLTPYCRKNYSEPK
jgi:hypothetical protein